MPSVLSPLVLAALLVLVAVSLPRHSQRQVAAIGMLLLALAAAATVIAPGDGAITSLVQRARLAGTPRATLIVNAALAAVGLGLLLAALGWGFVGRMASGAEPRAAGRRPSLAVGLAAVAVLGAPTLWTLVLATTALAALAAPAGRARLWLGLAAGAPLAALAWFACTVGGTPDVWLSALGEVPLSEAAQRAAAVPLLVAAGAWIAGIFWQGTIRCGFGWVGVFLLARVGTSLTVAGFDALGPVLFPVAAMLVLWAAWRRWTTAAALLALALAATTVTSGVGVVAVTLAAVALGAVDMLAPGRRWRAVAWAVAAAVAVHLLPLVLRAQVVWSLALLVALAVAVVRSRSVGESAEAI